MLKAMFGFNQRGVCRAAVTRDRSRGAAVAPITARSHDIVTSTRLLEEVRDTIASWLLQNACRYGSQYLLGPSLLPRWLKANALS